MATRKIIRIDEEKCDGCGLCAPSCAEGAIQIIGGKARLVSETYCDGLGACLGHCPQNAITIEEREAAEFDEEAVKRHLSNPKPEEKRPAATPVAAAAPAAAAPKPSPHAHGGCPGALAQMLGAQQPPPAANPRDGGGERSVSQLVNWPLQLHLVPTRAPYYENARLLIAADCVPFAYPDFHRDLLAGRVLLIGCPKLDDTETYRAKLAEVFRQNEIASVDIAFMQVPCCFGLVQLVKVAMRDAGAMFPLRLTKIGLRGEVLETIDVEQSAHAGLRG